MKFSTCIEMLFAAEYEEVPRRVSAARDAGSDAVEFWQWSNKDIEAIRSASESAGVAVAAILAEPIRAMTDPEQHAGLLAGLAETIEAGAVLGARTLIAQVGPDLPGTSRSDQHDAIVKYLESAADMLAGTGMRLGIEPLNTLVNHPGYYLSSTVEALDIVEKVARTEIGIVYDVYHSLVMGEDPVAVLDARLEHVMHVHVADHPGRHQPGTGTQNIVGAVAYIMRSGYDGYIGLEYRPIGDSAAAIRSTIELLDPTRSA